ncbi:hydrogen peroxide-inducible genes activator [Ferruginibacter sp. HRS2-29]|uniref:hydrogen peroxide-inducible genes activator n=1 Tax=Ferruginibacter sp. HRS2-29 TaxID=2487334 RepID=UPI0020CD9A8B|nr:hydrogen peroxide-inducible genes activator [Ferruginibacter sp. HRS2-29]MCP9750746.1 hydrogen peroxide-inducible genes activator [Ferruginibacter sp. HRS2-29]
MTLTQLEYIIALDTFRHFGKAAEKCFVTQPSLSMQVQKLEEELNVKIFSRNSIPVEPTEVGLLIIEQAKKILAESAYIRELIHDHKKIITGSIKLGIIPTLAPYLLPLFLHTFIKKYPDVKLSVSELTTDKILKRLRNGTLDAGIMATPLHEQGMMEEVLFQEEFVAYVSKKETLFRKKYLLPADIDVNKLWLLEEGHCLRSQVINLCALQKSAAMEKHFDYETGSIETLKRFVELHHGITLLPELATLGMPASRKQLLRYFKSPAPVREISMVTQKSFIKRNLVALLKSEIVAALPATFRKKTSPLILDI